jgi:general secretion pathway protein B
MSYILEALQKAERERSLGQVPNLETIHLPAPLPRRGLWLWLILIALLANALVTGAILSLPSINRSIETSAASGPIHGQSQPPESHAALAELSAKSDQDIFVPPAAERNPSQTHSAGLPQSPSLENPTGPLRTEALAIPPPQSSGNLPHHSLPELNLDVHVYSEVPAERFVLINSARYQEGERLKEGPLLERITPKGVILSYQGQRFSLEVNL